MNARIMKNLNNESHSLFLGVNIVPIKVQLVACEATSQRKNLLVS